MDIIKPNLGKNLTIELDGQKWERIPIKTHVITDNDDILDVVKKYATGLIKEGDTFMVSERVVAISQGRAWKISDIKPRLIAKILSKFVHKSPYGIGLGSPYTMELAIREAGLLRIILGAFFAVITKPFGFRGVFYKVVGKNINAIDGPCDYTLPPYNGYAKLGPKNPQDVAKKIAEYLGHDVVIIDANDLGVAILGKSNKNIPDKFYKDIFKDNPLGQSSEQTPLCILRKNF